MTDPTPTVTDPSIYQHVYYLHKAAGDSPEQRVKRHQLFIAELERAADTLRTSLGLPPRPIIWPDQSLAGRHEMVLRYTSGTDPWQSADGQTQAWLIVHQLPDAYVVRHILSRLGEDYPPSIFADLHRNLPWQPDPNRPEWLGQSLFYTGLSTAHPQGLAQAVFETAVLWHTSLTCGEMYRRRTPQGPDLLVFISPDQERLANDFFGQTALELGWYAHKGLGQTAQYNTYLHPTVMALERASSVTVNEVQVLDGQITAGDTSDEMLQEFYQHLRRLGTDILDNDKQLTAAENIADTIQINVENYRQVIETNEFLTNPGQDEIFTHQLHYLKRLLCQIQTDLRFWKRRLEHTRRILEILLHLYGPITNLTGPIQQSASKPGQGTDIKLSLERQQTHPNSQHILETAPGTGNRWAVLVGVNRYQDWANYGQLQVCVKDVEATREQLVAGGFAPDRFRLLTDSTDDLPTKANILVALRAIANVTEPDDLLLFYYSGHGDEDNGESYLVAHDGRRLVLSDTAVPFSRVKAIMEEAPARAKVIFLDACHSGADIGGKGPKLMSAEFIQRVFEQAEGMVVMASCKQRQLSYEWRAQQRSVFTHFLLEALAGKADYDDKGFVTVQDTSRYVVNGVKLWASQHNVSQTPTLQYEVVGDIILMHYHKRPGID